MIMTYFKVQKCTLVIMLCYCNNVAKVGDDAECLDDEFK